MHAIYFNFHDFSASTSLLSTAELGLYLKLLALYYEQEAPIQEAQCEPGSPGLTLAEISIPSLTSSLSFSSERMTAGDSRERTERSRL